MKIKQFTFLQLVIASLLSTLAGQELRSQTTTSLPVIFEENMVILQLALSPYDTLYMYTDTGGFNYLYRSGKKKLGARRLRRDNLWSRSGIGAVLEKNGLHPKNKQSLGYLPERDSPFDGMLGRSWFTGGIWTLDYTTAQMFKREESFSPTAFAVTPLFFPSQQKVELSRAVPRIEIKVGKDTLSLILDTGAQIHLSPELQDTLNSQELVAGSFINRSVFNRWRRENPDWTVYMKGDTSFKLDADLIVVPQLHVASVSIGPVMFAVRDDRNFEMMSTLFTDQPVVGALGGNALCLLGEITIDYVHRSLRVHASNTERPRP